MLTPSRSSMTKFSPCGCDGGPYPQCLFDRLISATKVTRRYWILCGWSKRISQEVRFSPTSFSRYWWSMCILLRGLHNQCNLTNITFAFLWGSQTKLKGLSVGSPSRLLFKQRIYPPLRGRVPGSKTQERYTFFSRTILNYARYIWLTALAQTRAKILCHL